MIEYVSGTLVEKKPTAAVVDVQGLGYRLLVPTSTFEGLPAPGKEVKLFAHQYVREDAMTLFGFGTRGEREMFETMLGVSGVGPKLALAALSGMSPSEIRDHVVAGDTSVLTNIHGVGRKTADRLIVELRDRVTDLEHVDGGAPLTGGTDERAAARADALAGLEALGYSRAAAEKNIRKVLRNHPNVQSAEELIRLSLRE